jgi:hypothetical protein
MEVVESGLSKIQADQLEAQQIKVHDAYSKKGYNWCASKPTSCKRWWAVRRLKFVRKDTLVYKRKHL